MSVVAAQGYVYVCSNCGSVQKQLAKTGCCKEAVLCYEAKMPSGSYRVAKAPPKEEDVNLLDGEQVCGNCGFELAEEGDTLITCRGCALGGCSECTANGYCIDCAQEHGDIEPLFDQSEDYDHDRQTDNDDNEGEEE